MRFIGRSATPLAMRVTNETKWLEVFDPKLSEWSHHRNVPFSHIKSGKRKGNRVRRGRHVLRCQKWAIGWQKVSRVYERGNFDTVVSARRFFEKNSIVNRGKSFDGAAGNEVRL